MKRALVLCPGRGSYSRDSLGSLAGVNSASLDIFDEVRKNLKRPTVRELDALEKFSSRFHIRGENASCLTAGVSLADLDQVNTSAFDIVGVIGNSMGWYTALGYAGALPMDDCATLIETMGQYQADNIVGGQIVYPFVNEDWTVNGKALALLERVIRDTDGLYWSIRLGGQAVLGGSESALNLATEALPLIAKGSHQFPLRLPFHSAFHTPHMKPTSEVAIQELKDLRWTSPQVTMIDGMGQTYRPHSGQPAAIRDYTLGPQVHDPFDLTLCIKTALRTVGPDVVILPGPGSNLGSAVAQSMIQEGWAGITSRDDFIARQNTDPILLSMRWPDQRALAVGQ